MYRKTPKSAEQKGFTIIELMLAMAFFTFILIFIVTSLMQVMRTYNRGLSLKSVNQSGRSIGAEVQRAIQASKGDNVNISVANNDWRVCLGDYSFVWNEDSDSDKNRYSAPNTGTRLGFVKVRDTSQALCSPTPNDVNKTNSTELLSDNLKLQRVDVTPVAENYLYRVDFIIATAGDNLLDASGKCRVDSPVDAQFCALSEFSVYALAKR